MRCGKLEELSHKLEKYVNGTWLVYQRLGGKEQMKWQLIKNIRLYIADIKTNNLGCRFHSKQGTMQFNTKL